MIGEGKGFLAKHNRFVNNKNKLLIIFALIAVLVVIGVFWWLKLVGITATGDAMCGLEEHTHSEGCYESTLSCILEEVLYTDETSEVSYHTHDEYCYENTMICDIPEHTHSSYCYCDPEADVETKADWLASIEGVVLTEDAAYNVSQIAQSQIGYTESERNFSFDAEGNRNGYTRYGEWYGNPYGEWNGLFASFCLSHCGADLPHGIVGSSPESMRLACQRVGIYRDDAEYKPVDGSLVFFDRDADGVADSVGILCHMGDGFASVIEGDVEGSVSNDVYNDLGSFMGYAQTERLSINVEIPESEETEPEPTEPQASVSNDRMLFSLQSQANNITYTSQIDDQLTDVAITTLQGVPIENNGIVYIGEKYTVSLKFSETNTGSNWVQFQPDENGFLTYQVPENFECDPSFGWQLITATNEDGTTVDVGEYYVDETGLLRVRFYEDADGNTHLDKYSNADFTINFKATIAPPQSGNSSEIVFNDEIKVDLNVDGGAAYTVEKTHGEFDKDNHTLEYTIKVEATNGVVHDLIVHDQIWDTHHALTDTIIVTDLEGNVLDPQPGLTDPPNTNIVGPGGFTLTGFPDFAAGSGFLITYKSELNQDKLGNETAGLWNSVTTSGNDTDGNTVGKYTEDWEEVELKKLAKEGKQATVTDDDGNIISLIEWEVVIYKNQEDLEGTVIIDTLGEGLSYYTGEKILIKRYDEWGNKLPSVELSWDEVTVEGNRLTFELPAGNSFNITYYSQHTQLAEGEEQRFNNNVQATINNKHEETDGWADVVGFIPRVSKSASGDDGKYAYFTIEADVPGIIKDKGNFFLTDHTAFWGYNNDAGYLYVENKPEDIVITATTESGQTITFTHYVEGGPTENTYILMSPTTDDLEHSFNIYFNTAEPNKADSKWILAEDSVLTITYKIPFDAKTGTEWFGELTGDLTLKDVLLQDYALANEVYLDYTDTIDTKDSVQYKYSPMLLKDSVILEDGNVDYTVTFRNTVPGSNGNDGYLGGDVDMVYFTDIFDEKLEYVDGTLTLTCYDPWRPSLWLCKYTYNGSIDSNTISIKATDLVLSECNPEAEQYGWSIKWWLATLTDYQKYYQNSSGGDHVFTYTLKIKDEYLNSTDKIKYTFDNTAELTWDEDGTTGPATDSTEFETGLLDKQVVRKDSKLEFAIYVNRNALDMLEGTDTITVEDTMTDNLSVYWNSIKFFYEDANGNWIDFDSDESRYTHTVIYDPDLNRLTFTLPDSLHIRIDYTTLITEEGFVSVNNNVRVDGKAEVTDVIDAIFRVEGFSGEAGGSNNNITLIKQDGITFAPLPSATFLLYGPMGDSGASRPEGVKDHIVTDDGKTLYYISTYTTGEDGSVNIETQYLTVGGPYALVETVAPAGYELPDKPTYFYFYDTDPNGVMPTVTTIVVVENFNDVFVFPGTGGLGIKHLAFIGLTFMSAPVLYSIIRRKREGRLTRSP